MARKLGIHRLILLATACSIVLVGTPVQSQSSNGTSNTPNRSGFVFPTDSTPKETAGGAARGSCGLDSSASANTSLAKRLTVLKPDRFVGQTVSAHPTLLLYVPPGSPTRAKFALQELKTNRQIYQATLNLEGISGLAKLPIPDNAPPLEVGKTYLWDFQILCDFNEWDAPIISGSIARVNVATPTNSTAIAASLEQADWYAKRGIWHEAIMMLYELRQTQPHNLEVANAWVALLESVELTNFVLAPVADRSIPIVP